MKQMLKIHTMKCDAAGCGYREPVDMENQSESLKAWINKPCPKCGAPLLTQADYDAHISLNKTFAHPFNRFRNC